MLLRSALLFDYCSRELYAILSYARYGLYGRLAAVQFTVQPITIRCGMHNVSVFVAVDVADFFVCQNYRAA